MYATYFLLFGHFFLGSYIFKTKRDTASNDQAQYQEPKSSKKID